MAMPESLLLRTYDTVVRETEARRATSWLVGLRGAISVRR
jgi:hypothetical protein